jgi:hypothetical protein
VLGYLPDHSTSAIIGRMQSLPGQPEQLGNA